MRANMGEEKKDMNTGFSILDMHTSDHCTEENAYFYQDLNLLQVIDKLVSGWGKKIRDYYMYLPETPQEEAYRRAIYCDIKKEAVYNALMELTENLAGVEELRVAKGKVRAPIQKAVWQIREVVAYCDAYEKLEKELEQAELSSEGMLGFLSILKSITDSDVYRQSRKQTQNILKEIKELRFVITYDKDRMSVSVGGIEGEGRYEEMLAREGGKEIKHIRNPFWADPTLTGLEEACLEILIEKKKEFFREIIHIAQINEEYEKPVLKRFEEEVLFYLSFRTLQRDMEKEGFCFTTPEITDGRRMEAKGLYDLALALSNLSTGERVVPNDFYYGEGESFFVLTGPNQGGKTTFARSLGQLVYFSRLGLDVPARSAFLPFFPDIQTHFSVEESVETGRGKLKEELTRLAPMMEDRQKGTFVIINELFTTAASYDARIMGKKVLKHFIGLDCMGIYVTHLKELAEEQDGVVSLRAMLDNNRIQTFEIQRGEAEDTPCAENRVNKYRLTYEQLKERLS